VPHIFIKKPQHIRVKDLSAPMVGKLLLSLAQKSPDRRVDIPYRLTQKKKETASKREPCSEASEPPLADVVVGNWDKS